MRKVDQKVGTVEHSLSKHLTLAGKDAGLLGSGIQVRCGQAAVGRPI